MVKILATTSPGIEDLLAIEFNEVFGKNCEHVEVRGNRGRVIAHIKESSWLWERINTLTLVHRVGVLLSSQKIRTNIEGLNDIKNAILSSNLIEYITPKSTFAVRAERVGSSHEYTSIDIARVAGEAIIVLTESYYGSPPKVELDYPEVIVNVDVIENTLYIYVSLTGDISLHRRGYRVYDHPAALKPTLARAMILLSGAQDGETILDPMCGSGTIPIEASFLFENSINMCMDINIKHLTGAKMNAITAGVLNRIVFINGDSRKIEKYIKDEIDHIITNPPYGIKLGNPRAVKKLYREFLFSALRVLKNHGRLTIITPEYEYINYVIEHNNLDFKKIEERTVAHGGLYPKIIVYEKV